MILQDERQEIKDWEETDRPIEEEYIHHPVYFRGMTMMPTHLGKFCVSEATCTQVIQTNQVVLCRKAMFLR